MGGTLQRWRRRGYRAVVCRRCRHHQIALEPVVGRTAIEEFHGNTFAGGPLTCTPINLVVDGDWGALEWTDPDGFRGCGFFRVRDGLIVHQRGYWDSAQLNEIHPDVHGE